jgi:hypothetical protein
VRFDLRSFERARSDVAQRQTPFATALALMLYDLKRSALAMNVPLEVVVGGAPGWEEPWSRVRLVHVEQDHRGWPMWLIEDDGCPIDEGEVQRARLPIALR